MLGQKTIEWGMGCLNTNLLIVFYATGSQQGNGV